ncbi:MAG TPA: peroxiredoxin [Fimbriiglobus sp.]|nr:peroxiredoxin [Fimbriiglobus sp.]
MCGFRDLLNAKEIPAGTVVLGASADTVELNQKFADKNEYPFALLSDHELKLIRALGIQIPGRPMAQRVTFLVGKDGKIAKIYGKVSPRGHAEQVAKDVKELAAKK